MSRFGLLILMLAATFAPLPVSAGERCEPAALNLEVRTLPVQMRVGHPAVIELEFRNVDLAACEMDMGAHPVRRVQVRAHPAGLVDDTAPQVAVLSGLSQETVVLLRPGESMVRRFALQRWVRTTAEGALELRVTVLDSDPSVFRNVRQAQELVVGKVEVEIAEGNGEELRQFARELTQQIEAGVGDVEELGVALATIRDPWVEPLLVAALESGNLQRQGSQDCLAALDEMGGSACEALRDLRDRGLLGWPSLQGAGLQCLRDETVEERDE